MKRIVMILLMTTSCQSIAKEEISVDDCIEMQIELYGDLCAESSSGYEEMNGSDAHFEGVKCAVESIKACLDVRRDGGPVKK